MALVEWLGVDGSPKRCRSQHHRIVGIIVGIAAALVGLTAGPVAADPQNRNTFHFDASCSAGKKRDGALSLMEERDSGD